MAKYFEKAHIMNYLLKISLNASSYPCAPKFKMLTRALYYAVSSNLIILSLNVALRTFTKLHLL